MYISSHESLESGPNIYKIQLSQHFTSGSCCDERQNAANEKCLHGLGLVAFLKPLQRLVLVASWENSGGADSKRGCICRAWYLCCCWPWWLHSTGWSPGWTCWPEGWSEPSPGAPGAQRCSAFRRNGYVSGYIIHDDVVLMLLKSRIYL